MKKGRPGTTLGVLCEPSRVDMLTRIILTVSKPPLLFKNVYVLSVVEPAPAYYVPVHYVSSPAPSSCSNMWFHPAWSCTDPLPIMIVAHPMYQYTSRSWPALCTSTLCDAFEF